MAFDEAEGNPEEYKGSRDTFRIDASLLDDKPYTKYWEISVWTDPVTIEKIGAEDRDVWEMRIHMKPSSRLLLLSREDYTEAECELPAVYGEGGQEIILGERGGNGDASKAKGEAAQAKKFHDNVVAKLRSSFSSHTAESLEKSIRDARGL